MSLDLRKLLPQVDLMVQSIVSRNSRIDALIPDVLTAFARLHSDDQELLQRKLDQAGETWPAAMPTNEEAQKTYPAPQPRREYSVFATDGSQIHPDRHSPTMYYLINIGRISLRYGSGAPPEISSVVKIYFDDDDLYDEFGSAISASIINGKRDVLELESLASLAENSTDHPSVALLDNGLLLWLAAQVGAHRNRQIDQLLHQYLKHLSRLQRSEALLAGFLDKPRHWNVVALLTLANTALEDVRQLTIKSNPYRGIIDRTIFSRILKPGFRSSLFVQRSKLNTAFRDAGHQIYFFYMHTGAGDNVVRVEVPEWVANSQSRLDIVHDALLQQCRQTEGYPYSLVRAHELALVSNTDRQNFESLIQNRLIDHGLSFSQSRKAETKRWTGRKRRFQV